MYLLGFVVGRQLARRLSRSGFFKLSVEAVDDWLFAVFMGMLIGARVLYMAVYFRPAPGEVWHWYTPLQFWHGGLSFHGALIGMLSALFWFSRSRKVSFWNLADTLGLCSPLGIAFGRIGNFINAELWGRETDVPWAMRFPIRDENATPVFWTTPRHPSQLYEAFGEGLLLFTIIWTYKRYARFEGSISAVWLCAYGAIRFVLEFFREKDEQLKYYFGWMTMGQILCTLMILAGIALYVWSLKAKKPIMEACDVL